MYRMCVLMGPYPLYARLRPCIPESPSYTGGGLFVAWEAISDHVFAWQETKIIDILSFFFRRDRRLSTLTSAFKYIASFWLSVTPPPGYVKLYF